MNRRKFLSLTGLGTVSFLLPGLVKGMETFSHRPPNIIFILADDLGYNHLGCYGGEKIKTPNIDQMADEGMLFTQAYAGSTVCAPSRATLMTGYHQGHASVRGNSGGIPLLDKDITVAEVLKQAGYSTGCFGKWGLGDARTTGIPTRQGFDEYFGTLDQVHAHFYYPEYLWHNEEKFPLEDNKNGNREQYSNDLFTEFALDFIQRHSEDSNPFFCYIPYTIPHTELLVPEDSLQEYLGKFPEEPFEYEGHYAGQENPHAAFAAMITRMDGYIGQILELIEEKGISENTIVIFTSDNGGQQDGAGVDLEFFNGNYPLRGWKGNLYEGGIRVPAIIRWPGKVAPGSYSDQIWAFWDFLPTAAVLAGVGAPENIDGVSIASAILGKGILKREPMYWEVYRRGDLYQAVRIGDMKAIKHGQKEPIELYNLRTDLAEKFNLAKDLPEIVEKAEKIFQESHTEPRPQEEPETQTGKRYR